jgi:hypothetical protein
MNYKPKKITAFFCVNLLAAYAPAVLWIMRTSQWLLDQPGGPGKPTMLLTSPVWLAWLLITLMMDATSVAAGWCLLAAFILLLFLASAALHNSWKAWVAMPSIVLVYSLLQAMLFASAISGLNAIG